MADPNYIYDPDDWDVTWAYKDRDMLKESHEFSMDAGDVKAFKTLVHGPERFLAKIVTEYDEDDWPVDTKFEWFDTEEEAKAAVAAASNDGDGEANVSDFDTRKED